MTNQLDKIKGLLLREMVGKATEADQQELQAWLQQHPSHRKLGEELLNHPDISKQMEAYNEINLGKAFRRNRKILGISDKSRVIRTGLAYAAGLALLIGLSIWMLRPKDPTTEWRLYDVEPGGKKAVLTLPDNRQIMLSENMKTNMKAGDTDILVENNEVHYSSTASGGTTDYHIIRTPHGGEYTVVLSDGTQVILNALSELKYLPDFSGGERAVELSGEAYFRVRADKSSPFYVTIGDFRIEVTGTSFNVNAYADKAVIQTTLCSGSINVQDLKTLRTKTLQAGEQILCASDTRSMTIEKVNPDLFTAWTKGYFRFDNTTVEEIFRVMERWYSIEYEYENEEVKKEKFTGKLPRFDRLESILEVMEKVSNVKFEQKENKIIIQ